MKLVCISDTHSLHARMSHPIPEGDVLIVAGDITNVGAKQDVDNFHVFLSKAPCKYKVVIAGNHDWCFANEKSKKSPGWLTKDDKSIIYLQDSEIVIDGVKFYGSPWQPEFYDWAFNLPRGEQLKEVWAKIPSDTDVLITHGAPAGILDPNREGNPVGCLDLLDRVLEVGPKVHVFGHLHSGYGIEERGSTTYVNASICNDQYIPERKPIVIEI